MKNIIQESNQTITFDLRKESNYNANKFEFLALSATEEKEEFIDR